MIKNSSKSLGTFISSGLESSIYLKSFFCMVCFYSTIGYDDVWSNLIIPASNSNSLNWLNFRFKNDLFEFI